MACVYFFNGKFFKDELSLDKFLMESYPLKSILGDLVFQLTKEQEVPAAKLTELSKDSNKIIQTLLFDPLNSFYNSNSYKNFIKQLSLKWRKNLNEFNL